MKDYNDKFVINTVYKIDYSSLENIICEVFNFNKRDFSIPCNEECGNDVSLTFNVDPCKQYPEDLTCNSSVGYFLVEMCYRGLIVPGQYLVDVSW